MRRFSKYLLAALLPLCVLSVRPLTPAAVLTFGQEIRLATTPVDPRDIFRGDYVTLSFAIEQVGASLLDEEEKETLLARLRYSEWEFNIGDSPVYVYVSLEPDRDGIWQPVKMSMTPPEAGVYLRAWARGQFRVRMDNENITLDYGDNLRRYYVKENTGRELEDAARRGKLTGVVKVWRGRAVLTSVEQ